MDQNWNRTGDEGGGLSPAFPVLLNRFSSSVVWSCDQIRVVVTSDSSASKNPNILTADVPTSVSLPSFMEACFCPKIPALRLFTDLSAWVLLSPSIPVFTSVYL